MLSTVALLKNVLKQLIKQVDDGHTQEVKRSQVQGVSKLYDIQSLGDILGRLIIIMNY